MLIEKYMPGAKGIIREFDDSYQVQEYLETLDKERSDSDEIDGREIKALVEETFDYKRHFNRS